MRWSRSPLILAAAVLLGASALTPAKDDGAKASEKSDKKKKKGKPAAPGKGDTPAAAEADADKPKISVPVPPGHDAKGLVIPYRNSEGKLQMRFTMEIGKRTDVGHMDMTKLLIETFDEEGKPEMTIDLPQSILDLNTKVISTESGALIKRSDFEIKGKTMEFNTDTKAGRLGGNVRMLIYNLEDETNPNPTANAGAK